MNKEQIISAIRRTAEANGGIALGFKRFESETGIGKYDWYGKFWVRWSDAVRDAGVVPNRMNEAYDVEFLVEKLALVTRQLGRVPVTGDLILAARNDPEFPSKNVFSRLGSQADRVSRVIAFCASRPGYDDIANLWRRIAVRHRGAETIEKDNQLPSVGYVYLLKHGSRREYKVGRTYNPLRREGEMAIQLPEKMKPIHYIETDDPAGIEAYWHKRFASKRKEGEWSALSHEDVRAFKRWKRIY